MYKEKILFVLLMFSLSLTQVKGQGFVKKLMSKIYAGPKIEANASNFFLSDMKGTKSKMGIGGSVGGFIGLRVSSHFAIQEDFSVYYRTSTLEREFVDHDIKNIGTQMTIYGIGKWKIGNGNVMVGAGPFAEFGINAKSKLNGVETDLYKQDVDGNTPLKRFNAGAALTVGYEFRVGLQVCASYKLGLLDALDAQRNTTTLRPSIISLGIAYTLSK